MSREVDMSKPLGELDIDDLRYVATRNLLSPADEEKAMAFLKAHDAGEDFDDEEKPLEERTIKQLEKYAEDNDIDLGDAKRKDDIIEAIRAAEGGD